MASEKKKGGKLKWIIIVIVAIVIIAVIGSSGSGSSDEKKSTVDLSQSENNASDDNDTSDENSDNQDESSDDAQGEESNEFTVGQSFEDGDLKITINETDLNFTDYDDDYGWYTPDEGMKYIMISFTYENNGSSDEYVSIYDFDCYADNTTCDQVYSIDDSNFINTNLSAGRNVSFKVYFSVPEDAQSIELEYETNYWTSEKVVIKLQ